MQDVLLVIHIVSELKSLTNNAKIRSLLKFQLTGYMRFVLSLHLFRHDLLFVLQMS